MLIGVFVVAYELRQNTAAMEANTRQEFAAQDLEYLATALDTSVLAVALSNEITRRWWPTVKESYSKPFVDLVSEMGSDSGPK